MARAPAGAWRLGQQTGAAASIPRLARLRQAMGGARRPAVGAGDGRLSLAPRSVQRHSGRPPASARRARARSLRSTAAPVTPDAGRLVMARVLMTADAVGGVWTYALELARALIPAGLSTTIATM